MSLSEEWLSPAAVEDNTVVHHSLIAIDGVHNIFHHENWRAKRSCDASSMVMQCSPVAIVKDALYHKIKIQLNHQ